MRLFGADRVLEETVTRHTFRRALRARSIGRAGQLAVETNAMRKVSFACNEQASLRSKLSFFFLFTSIDAHERERLCFSQLLQSWNRLARWFYWVRPAGERKAFLGGRRPSLTPPSGFPVGPAAEFVPRSPLKTGSSLGGSRETEPGDLGALCIR